MLTERALAGKPQQRTSGYALVNLTRLAIMDAWCTTRFDRTGKPSLKLPHVTVRATFVCLGRSRVETINSTAMSTFSSTWNLAVRY